MRLIDADALIDWIDVGHLRHPSELCYSEIDVANIINHAPTVDAVPREKYDRLKENAEILSKACAEKEYVVRCRDCKYLDKGENESEAWSLCVYKSWQPVSVGDEHFCSWGERKDGEQK